MAVSLYRQYRPQTFAGVVGQDAAVDVLRHALSHSRIGHAYLFSGPRGCGKTSVARILAKALNCLAPDGVEPCGRCPNCLAITAGESLDVVEIDGASNNSVDEVRELKSHVTLAPFSSKYKVYIIDEVHMLSTAAFNALLKTLEEPPSTVVFILATTEPHKVPVTIRSRCQHIPFHSIGAKEIFGQLQRVCGAEKVEAQQEALWEVARQADGAMRDALSMLEQVINRSSGGEVTLADVEATLGAGSRPALERWLSGLRNDESSAYTGLRAMMSGGASPQRVLEELFTLTRNLWLASRWPDVVEALDVSDQEKNFIREEAPNWTAERLRAMLDTLVNLISQARLGVRTDVLLGLLMLELTRPAEAAPVQARPAVSRPSASERTEPSPPPPPPSKNANRERTAPPQETRLPLAEPEPPKPVSRPPSGPLPALDWRPLPDEERALLLSTAREADFVLYCALLDATPQGAEGRLLLDMGDRYCYEVLRLERHSAGLVRALSQYSGIFLRCGEETFACPAGLPAPKAPSRKEADAGGDLGIAEGVPRFPAPSEEPLPPLEAPDGGGVPWIGPGEERGAPDEENGLPFGGIIKEVSRLMKGEVVLVRRSGEGAGEMDVDEDEGNDDGSDE